MARVVSLSLLLVLCASAAAQTADHPWQINSKDGKSSLVLGFLGQVQAEFLKADGAGDSQDLYLRRFRLIASGKVMDKLTFFIDTDSPNLGKGTAARGKVEDRIYFQDIILTYSFRPELQLDAGLLLVSLSHNGGQGATSLLPVDYGPFSFLASEPTGSRSGRDYGLQARGYLFNQHFEYRLGIFQGSRGPDSTNPFRYAGRFVWYPLEAETGFFYTGTTLGARRILAVGASFDHQMNYNTRSVDLFYDQPLRGGDSLTLQADLVHHNGGDTFPQLRRENVWLVEGGYYNRRTKLGPFVQLSRRDFRERGRQDWSRHQAGIAYWASGHRLNVKLGIGRVSAAPSPDCWQILLQGQVYIH